MGWRAGRRESVSYNFCVCEPFSMYLFNTLFVIQGGKALTMTMTPWNLTPGQWSKNLTIATDCLESSPWSMVKVVILWSNFVVKSKVYHFDHRKFE